MIARMTRFAFWEVLGQDYIRAPHAQGLMPFEVVFKHAFSNASLQIIPVTMLQAGTIFGRSVITEGMFSLPELVKFIVESIAAQDFPMVQSGTLFVGIVFVFFNLVADFFMGHSTRM